MEDLSLIDDDPLGQGKLLEEEIPWVRHILDAVRVSDGQPVFLKHISKSSTELELGKYLSSSELLKDPRNHTAPLLDVLEDESDPENVIVVLPFLRPINAPYPASVKECIELVQQTLEGLVFLHEHKIAHRDCAHANIMMDGRALFPQGWHPQSLFLLPDAQVLPEEEPSRTAIGGVRYYLVDFGISTWKQEKTVGLAGQERAPELSPDVPYDPYKLDVYILGMAYKQLFEELTGAEFVDPLVAYMTPKDPDSRPSAAEALERFEQLKKRLS
ncbi:hypothetical protein FRB99_003327, partial [Tulasnella sp. 403]